MPNSLSSISVKSEIRLPETRRAYRNFEGTVFGLVAKKLFCLFRLGFSTIPKTIVVSNADVSTDGLTSSSEELSWQSLEAREDACVLGLVRGELIYSPKGDAIAIPNKKGQRWKES